MEKKSTLLAFFKPLNSKPAVEKTKEITEAADVNKDTSKDLTKTAAISKDAAANKTVKAINNLKKDGSNVLNKSADAIIEEDKTDVPIKEKRKRKAVDDVEKLETKKKLKAEKAPASPSIQNFFKKINTPTEIAIEVVPLDGAGDSTSADSINNDNTEAQDNTSEETAVEKAEIQNDDHDKDDCKEKACNEKEDLVNVKEIPKNKSSKRSKSKSVDKKKCLVNVKIDDITVLEEVINNKAGKDKDDITVVQEVINDKSAKDKISLNIFGKKGRRSKEKVRHDSGGSSDVSLDWKDDPEDLDFDPTLNVNDSKKIVEPEKVDKKQRSIKDAFSFMMQKKAKTDDTSNIESIDKSSTESNEKSAYENNEKSANKSDEKSAIERDEKSADENNEKCANDINDKCLTKEDDTANSIDCAKATTTIEKKDAVTTETVSVNDTTENKDEKENDIKEKDDEHKVDEIKADVTNTLTPQVKDTCLMKMLSALSAVKDDIDENVEEEELDFTPKTKRKKKKVFTPILNGSSKTNSMAEKILQTPKQDNIQHTPKRSKILSQNSLDFEDKENTENTGEKVYTVMCKGVEAKLYMDKFISGGVGDCILYNGVFLPPNKFELEAGCRGKKYKETLYVNKKPLVHLLKALGMEGQTKKGAAARSKGTPGSRRASKSSRGDSSGRDTPCSGRTTPLSSGRATPYSSGRETPLPSGDIYLDSKSGTETDVESTSKKLEDKELNAESAIIGKKPRKRQRRIESSEVEEDSILQDTPNPTDTHDTPHPTDTHENTNNKDNDTDNCLSSRRSGRIARNHDKLEEKRIEQQKIEDKLEELEKVENERKKRGRLVFPKQIAPSIPETKELIDLESSSSSSDASEDETDGDEEKPTTKKKAPAKLASIFATKKKVVEDPEKVAARRAFLMSSAPDQCRNQLAQSAVEEQEADQSQFSFPKISHIQQSDTHPFWSQKNNLVNFEIRNETILEIKLESFTGQFLSKCEDSSELIQAQTEVDKLNPSQIRNCVSKLKSNLSDRFPINKLFRRILHSKLLSDAKEFKTNPEQEIKPLKKRKRRSKEPELGIEYRNDLVSCEAWTNKYRPRCAEDFIVNRDEAVKLRDWLSSWSQSRHDRGSQSSSATSDSEFDECSELAGTCALLTGQPGNGKSAAVYSIAEELGLHVLEVNASSCRTGKQVTSMLLEATQSRQVSTNSSQPKLSFFKPSSTPSIPASPSSKPSDKYRKALILFEDIDIVFEDLDTGFYAAVSKICSGTKRPIVFTSSDNRAMDIVQKHIKCRFQHFRFTENLNPDLVSANLHLICLSEGLNICLDSLRNIATSSSCLRQSVLTTQYLTKSQYLQEKVLKSDIGNRRVSSEQDCIKIECSGDEDDSGYRKLLENSSSKSRGSHKIVEYELVAAKSSSYSHSQAMGQLNKYFNLPEFKRKSLFPLKSEDDLKLVPGLPVKPVNPLLNSDVFDTEVDQVDNIVANVAVFPPSPPKDKRKYTRAEITSMQGLADFLDVHSSSVQFTKHGLQDEYDLIMKGTQERSYNVMNIEQDELLEAEDIEPRGSSEAEQEILCSTLPCQLIDARARVDTLTGIRTILRYEECRKVVCREGKRGGRFYHYLAKYGFNPSPTSLANVCNTFL